MLLRWLLSLLTLVPLSQSRMWHTKSSAETGACIAVPLLRSILMKRGSQRLLCIPSRWESLRQKMKNVQSCNSLASGMQPGEITWRLGDPSDPRTSGSSIQSCGTVEQEVSNMEISGTWCEDLPYKERWTALAWWNLHHFSQWNHPEILRSQAQLGDLELLRLLLRAGADPAMRTSEGCALEKCRMGPEFVS